VNQVRLNDQLDLILSESTINYEHVFVESLPDNEWEHHLHLTGASEAAVGG